MSWILDESELVLRGHGYSTSPIGQPDALAFEDDVLLGFVIDYRSVGELSGNWQSDQDSILRRFSPALRVAKQKAWNVYFCFFTELAPQSAGDRFLMELIEADLSNTRKVPRHSLKAPADIAAALSPVLPIQNRAQLGSDSFEDRLARQLDIAVPGPAAALFLTPADEAVVGQAIIEALR